MKVSICQSCGQKIEKAGTDKDGTFSDKYCEHCYQDGAFIHSFSQPWEMLYFMRGQLRKKGLPLWKRWWITRKIPTLERWKNK